MEHGRGAFKAGHRLTSIAVQNSYAGILATGIILLKK
jgi:hypothetical protein